MSSMRCVSLNDRTYQVTSWPMRRCGEHIIATDRPCMTHCPNKTKDRGKSEGRVVNQREKACYRTVSSVQMPLRFRRDGP